MIEYGIKLFGSKVLFKEPIDFEFPTKAAPSCIVADA
jgi:hypothetical protein